MKYSQLILLSFLLSCDSSRNKNEVKKQIEYSQQFNFYKTEREFILIPICKDSTIHFGKWFWDFLKF